MTSPKEIFSNTMQTRIVKETFSWRTLWTTVGSFIGTMLLLGTVGKGFAANYFVTVESFNLRVAQTEQNLATALDNLSQQVNTQNKLIRNEMEINRLGPQIDSLKSIEPTQRTQFQRRKLAELERRYNLLVTQNANP